MSDLNVRMVLLSTKDLDQSIAFYIETLGMTLKFRDGDRYAAIDGGSITIALAADIDHPIPGEVVVGIRTGDVDATAAAIAAGGGTILKLAYNDGHERRAIVRDNSGNGLVIYGALPR